LDKLGFRETGRVERDAIYGDSLLTYESSERCPVEDPVRTSRPLLYRASAGVSRQGPRRNRFRHAGHRPDHRPNSRPIAEGRQAIFYR